MLLLPWGGVDVNYILPSCLGTGLLWGRGTGLGLLGGGSLCHVGGLVLIVVVVIVVDRVVVAKVVVVVVGCVVNACII